jgi:hypothetical protein
MLVMKPAITVKPLDSSLRSRGGGGWFPSPDTSLTIHGCNVALVDEEKTLVADKKSRDPREEEAKTDPQKPRHYQSGSFLVRFWVEPSESGEPVLRGCIKNLKTGKEHYVDDPGKVGDLVRGHLNDREQPGEEKDAQGEGEQPWEDRH